MFRQFNTYRKEEAMRKWSAVFAAAVLAVTLLSAGSASAVVYDSFTTATLNTTLWTQFAGTYNGGGDLTINLNSFTSPYFQIDATVPISSSTPFEAQVPFSMASTAGFAQGSLAYVLIAMGNSTANITMVGWGQANKIPTGGMTLTGTVFLTGTSTPTNAYTTALNAATLGIKYDGAGSAAVGYYDGASAWHLLDTYTLTTDSPFSFSLQAAIQTVPVGINSSYAFLVPEVRFNAIPIPGALYLLAPGLAALALARRRFGKQ
jgi:hypothetical protein